VYLSGVSGVTSTKNYDTEVNSHVNKTLSHQQVYQVLQNKIPNSFVFQRVWIVGIFKLVSTCFKFNDPFTSTVYYEELFEYNKLYN